MFRHTLRELAVLCAAVLVPCAVGALAAWLFEGLAFFFGSLAVISIGAVVAFFTSFRMRDNWGSPWGAVSFLLVLLGGGYLGIVTIIWITDPFNK